MYITWIAIVNNVNTNMIAVDTRGEKTMNNQEIKARGGKIFLISNFEHNVEVDYFKKLENFVTMPEYKTSGASPMDLVAAINEDVIIPSGEIRIIPTGGRVQLSTFSQPQKFQ